MLSYEQAVIHARKHVASLTPIEDCVWVVRKGMAVSDDWFFDYAFDVLPGKERPMIAGAPGYFVQSDGSVQAVGWAEYHRLGLRELKKAEPDAPDQRP